MRLICLTIMKMMNARMTKLIATVMKFGDRSALGSTMLATSLVADVQLLAAAVAWGYFGTNSPVIAIEPLAAPE